MRSLDGLGNIRKHLNLMTSPVLACPSNDGNFVLDTDASNYGAGAVLSQIQNGEERVVSYFSKSFTKTERNYCVTRRELLAIVMAVKHFHPYLYGQKFKIRTDHGALTWLMRFKNPEGQTARWLEILSTYDMTIEHRAGRLHSNADALSRRPCLPMDCDHCARKESRYELNLDINSDNKSETFENSSCVKIPQKSYSPLKNSHRVETERSDSSENEKVQVDSDHNLVVTNEKLATSSNKDDQCKPLSIDGAVELDINIQRVKYEDTGPGEVEPPAKNIDSSVDEEKCTDELEVQQPTVTVNIIRMEDLSQDRLAELQLADSNIKLIYQWKLVRSIPK